MSETPEKMRVLSSAHVLVVEDDAVLRHIFLHMVAAMGAEVRTAENGAVGLQVWKVWRPDLVLTDILMPMMDGLEMSRSIKALDADAQIVVVTSSSEVGHLRLALDIGIDRYVLKPVDPILLGDALVKALRDAHRLRELRLAKLVFEAAGEGMVVTDAQGIILTVNPAFCEISGYREDEVLGKTTAILNSGKQDRDFYRGMWDRLRAVGRWSGEIVNRRKSGELYPEWLSIVEVKDPAQRATRYVGLFSDITERKREEDHIRRLAHYDILTGLPNRILFADHLKRAVARMSRAGGKLAVLYLDLDRFKPVNDLYGHAAGDQVLMEAARRMAACMRTGDTISRRGGDEFVALLEARDAKNSAAIVGRKLIQAVSQPYEIDGHHLVIGASIGVALFPDDAGSADSLLAAADTALYAAKEEGRGDFRFFRLEDQLDTHARLALEEALRRGVKEGGFELRYLPEFSLRDGRLERVEALLRFNHPGEGLLEPGRFLEIVERLGLTPELGMQSLAEAAHLIGILGQGNIGLTMDVSALQLAHLSSSGDIEGILRESGLAPNAVTFEFPESAVDDNESGLRNLLALTQKGFQIALDDFGAGLCSFPLLQKLPLSSIKVDLLFVEEIEANSQNRELLAALIGFARRLGIRAVAKGVNSPGQLAFLRECGCDAAQGLLFGEPLRAVELAPYLREQAWLSHF